MNHASIIDQNVNLKVAIAVRPFSLDVGYEGIWAFVCAEICLEEFAANLMLFR